MGYTRPSGAIGNDCQVGHGWVEGWFDWLELEEVLNAAVAVLGKNCCKREEEKSRADILTVHCFFLSIMVCVSLRTHLPCSYLLIIASY